LERNLKESIKIDSHPYLHPQNQTTLGLRENPTYGQTSFTFVRPVLLKIFTLARTHEKDAPIEENCRCGSESLSEARASERSNLGCHMQADARADLTLYFSCDESGKINDVNRRVAKLFRLRREDMLGLSVFDLFPGLRDSDVHTNIANLIKTGQAARFEVQSTPLDRRYEVVMQSTSGEVSFRARDVNPPLRRRGGLDKDSWILSVLQDSSIGFYRTTPDGRILWANKSVLKMLGYSSLPELLARKLCDDGEFEPHYNREDFKARVEARGEIRSLVAPWRAQDGTVRWLKENARAIRDPDGSVKYYEGTLERVENHAGVPVAQAETKPSSRSPEEVVFTLSADGSIVQWNPAFEIMTGYRTREILGRQASTVLKCEGPRSLTEALALASEKGIAEGIQAVIATKSCQAIDVRLTILANPVAAKQSRTFLVKGVRRLTFRDLSVSLRRLLEKASMLEDAERRRISHALYDDVGQNLSAIGLRMEMLGAKLESALAEDASVKSEVSLIIELTQAVQTTLRRVAQTLHPPSLEHLGIAAALIGYAYSMNETSQCNANISIKGEFPRLGQQEETSIYRIAQEAIANAVRHAGARKIVVELSSNGPSATMSICDDGSGFEVADGMFREGVGLCYMFEQSRALGAELNIESSSEGGTCVTLQIPVPAFYGSCIDLYPQPVEFA
jgi:PAS domain S-box-containing protein